QEKRAQDCARTGPCARTTARKRIDQERDCPKQGCEDVGSPGNPCHALCEARCERKKACRKAAGYGRRSKASKEEVGRDDRARMEKHIREVEAGRVCAVETRVDNVRGRR